MNSYCKCIDMTSHAVSLCAFPKGAKVLDVGCADGQDVNTLKASGLDASGQDGSEALIKLGKSKYPHLFLRESGDSVLDDVSLSHDGVFFLWELSYTGNQAEAIHEAYCLLKKGGKLVISDIYLRAPDMPRFKSERDEAVKLWDTPRKHEDCESSSNPPSPFCQDGAFVRPALDFMVEKSGFKLLHWEDNTPALKSFIESSGQPDTESPVDAEIIKRLQSACVRPDIGFFLMIAEKI